MEKKEKQATQGVGVIWFIIGLMLVTTGNPGGWIFFILGLVYLTRGSKQGANWSSSNPKLGRLILVGITILAVIAVIVVKVIKGL
jgi:hypothetical protein